MMVNLLNLGMFNFNEVIPNEDLFLLSLLNKVQQYPRICIGRIHVKLHSLHISLLVVFQGVQSDIQLSRNRMSEFGQVTVTTKLDQLSYTVTVFQSAQFDYDMSGNRTGDLKRNSTLTIPLCHRG